MKIKQWNPETMESMQVMQKFLTTSWIFVTCFLNFLCSLFYCI